MSRTILLIITLIISIQTFGQNERKYIRSGNRIFMSAVKDTTKIDSVKFSKAETEYRKALNKRPTDTKWNFNLADALYKQKRFEEATGKFNELVEGMPTKQEKARTLHNLGNSQLMNKKIDESIDSYKKALRNNPSDLETKYNLAYAQMLKNQQQQQQQQQNQNQDQNKDQNKDQDKDKQDPQDNKDNKDNQDKQQQPQQNKISKQNAEQLLQALQNDERAIQDKVKKEKAARVQRSGVEKEW
jgi:tetratricopeptide (TPR) repeat protein